MDRSILTMSQIITMIFWYFFRSYKIRVYERCREKGMSEMYAFIVARDTSKKMYKESLKK